MKLYIVVKQLGDYPWTAAEVFTERRLAENYIECKESLDYQPKWSYRIVAGEIETVRELPSAADLDAVAAEQEECAKTGSE